jgi:glycosyltransferase involved in cell wall biosynthesis
MLFLVQTPHAWQGIRQRPHHLATRFAAAGHTVRWVHARYVRWWLRERARFHLAQPADPAPNFSVRTATLINGERLPPIRRWNQSRLRRALDSSSTAAPRILWLYNPHEAHLADSIPHDLLVYDIMDEYAGFPWSPPRIAAEEAELLARADWVFAGTHALYESKARLAVGRIECLLSGVEAAHFAPTAGNANDNLQKIDPAAADWCRRFDFILGYAGMLDLRLDLDLIRSLVREFPRWGFMLLGPHATPLGDLLAAPNVFAPGAVAYAQLPAYYHAFHAAWLPFVENDVTRNINPTKMLEYAAADLPIIAPDLPDVRRFYADGAWLYHEPAQCREMLMEIAQNPALRRSRLAAARGWLLERDWDAIAARMLARVQALLAANQP